MAPRRAQISARARLGRGVHHILVRADPRGPQLPHELANLLVIQQILCGEEEDHGDPEAARSYDSLLQLKQLRTLYLSFAIDEGHSPVGSCSMFCPHLDLSGLPHLEAVFLDPMVEELSLPEACKLSIQTQMWDLFSVWDNVADNVYACDVCSGLVGDAQMDAQLSEDLSSHQAPHLTCLWLDMDQAGYTDGEPLLLGVNNTPALQFLTIESAHPAHISIGALPQLSVLCLKAKNLNLQVEDRSALLERLEAVQIEWETCSESEQIFIDEVTSSKEVISKEHDGRHSIRIGEPERFTFKCNCMGIGACTKCLVEKGVLRDGAFLRKI